MMEIRRIKVSELALNEGQVEGLPKNPRQWTHEELDRLARSIEETPELFEARPVIAYDWKDGERMVVLGGNMRLTAARQLGWKDVPCIVFPRGTEQEKLAEIVIKDNGAFGSWDWDALANEWDSLPLNEWGVSMWKMPEESESEPSNLDLSESEIEARNKDFFVKISFPSTIELKRFLSENEKRLQDDFNAMVTVHGGAI